MNLSHQDKREKYRVAILGVLLKYQGTWLGGREISNLLVDQGISLTTHEIVRMIRDDPNLARRAEVDYEARGGRCLLYRLKPTNDR